jgi:hypothetical protein
MNATPAAGAALDHVVRRVREAVTAYDLIGATTDPVVVALSGGKDSIVLCLALRELGYEVAPVTVDMGYEDGWADRLRKLVAPLRLDPRILDVRSRDAGLPVRSARSIELRLSVLDRLDSRALERGLTPCTHCYSVKALALEKAALDVGARTVAFAHHMTDAQASLVKEALMHVDRAEHEHYERRHFEALAARLGDEVRSPHGGPLLDAIDLLVASGRVDTDEPPRQPLVGGTGAVEVVRPLVTTAETEVEAAVAAEKIETLGSGCGHGATVDTQTPREIVHWRVLRTVSEAVDDRLRAAVLAGLTERGEGRVNARARRRELLGPGYKPVDADLDKL